MKKYSLLFLLFFVFVKIYSQEFYFPQIQSLFDESLRPFYFGVASGDPRPDSVVLWTKVVTQSGKAEEVEWVLATDTTLQKVVQSGTAMASPESAFTVKIHVGELRPGTTYYYRFKYRDWYSPIGRTKTAPGSEEGLLRLAVVSCADYQLGHYNAYGHIARRNDIDAVVHLGDYIYEYGVRKGGPKRLLRNTVRQHIPVHTCTTLKDYRSRYAQYRLDPQLQECHRLHPFIAIWDDHEISNNINADTGSPEWERRKEAARQAYFEWLPIKDNERKSIIRSFTFGNLAEMWMLDGRLEGRSPQAKGPDDPSLYSKDRYMLGREQTEWLLNGMGRSKARWKIMGNQVLFSPLHDSKVFDRRPSVRMDRWDGYPVEQHYIFDFFYKNNIKNIIVLTGDIHTSWALDLTEYPLDKNKYDRKTGKGSIGAEFVTPGITSFNLDEIAPRFIGVLAKWRLKKKKHNPHLRYVDLVRHGYLTLTLTKDKAAADWYFIKRKDKVDLRIARMVHREIRYNGGIVLKK